MARNTVKSIDELCELLIEARRECPTGGHGKFLPMSALDDFITRDNVEAVLSSIGRLNGRGRETLDTVMQKCRKVFAILTVIGRLSTIQELINEGISDEHLPLSKGEGSQSKILYSAISETGFRTFSLQEKGTIFADDFRLKQWWFMAPILDPESKIWLGQPSIVEPGGKVDSDCPLPFLEEKSIRSTPGTVVYEIKLHRAHLRGFSVSDSAHTGILPALILKTVEEGKHPIVAVKQFHKREPFDAEKANLEKTGKLKNPHLISHLAVYQRDRSFCIIFPWADGGDLRNFWEEQNAVERTAELTLWSLEQMLGLASALAVLHKINGRHGDLKPDNILHFSSPKNKKGLLLIGDFGISKFHLEGTDIRGALITHSKATTPAYQAPEAGLPQIKARSRKYDTWSLGCIYLEFVIWLLYGVDAINAFRRARKDAPHQAFYDLINDRTTAVVHPIVSRAINDLKLANTNEVKNHDGIETDDHTTQTAIGALVDLIEKDLLLAAWENRSSAKEVEKKLAKIVDDAHKRPAFLFRRDSAAETPELFRREGYDPDGADYTSTGDYTATAGYTSTADDTTTS
jgi:serine/threonine protein kinase